LTNLPFSFERSEKFLVDRNGTPVKRFAPSAAIDTDAIESLL